MSTAIPITDISVGPRLRATDPDHVNALAASIADASLANPITICRRDDGDGYILVAGAHRLAAFQQLGYDEIPATIVDLDELERLILECDENLILATLSPADRATFTKRRKEAWEARHPEIRHGATLKQGSELPSRQVGDTGNAERFTADTARATKASERTVQRDAERGAKVCDQAMDMVRGTVLDTGSYLDRIKNLMPSEQVHAVKRDLALAEQHGGRGGIASRFVSEAVAASKGLSPGLPSYEDVRKALALIGVLRPEHYAAIWPQQKRAALHSHLSQLIDVFTAVVEGDAS